MKTDLILKFKQNLLSKVIWPITFKSHTDHFIYTRPLILSIISYPSGICTVVLSAQHYNTWIWMDENVGLGHSQFLH